MFIRVARWLALAAVFIVVSVVNPAYLAGCSSEDDDAQRRAMAEAELLAQLDIIAGTPEWTFTHDGQDYEVLLAVRQAPPPSEGAALERGPRFTSVAHACGTHTFYARASACATQYLMPVVGTLTLRRLGEQPAMLVDEVELSGMISLYGSSRLMVEDGSPGWVDLSYDESRDTYSLGGLSLYDVDAEGSDLRYAADAE